MNPLRLGSPPLVQPSAAPRAPDPARTAAQRAFFEMAAGGAQAATAAAPTQAARPSAAPQRIAIAPADPPTRPLRPGSLLDIKV